MEALDKHGAFKGTGLAIYRILRCNPWADGGLDPVKHLKKTLEKLPKDDQHKVFGANAMKLYKL